MNFIIPLLYAGLFSWIILKFSFFRNSGLRPALRLGIFWLKILAGILVLYVYTHFYKNPSTADVLLYYHDGKILYNSIFTHPGDFFQMLFGIGTDNDYFYQAYFEKMDRWQRSHDSLFFNDSRTIIRFNALFNLFAFGAFHANTVMMCFLSFSGLVAFFRAFKNYFPSRKNLLVFSVFLPPTLLFWSSGVLKEGVLMFSLGFFLYSSMNIFLEKKHTGLQYTILAFSLLFLFINKIYILLTLFPAWLAFLLFTSYKIRFKFIGFLLVHLMLIGGGLFLSKKFFEKDFVTEIINRQRDFINVARGGVYMVRDSVLVRMEYADRHQVIRTEKKDTVRIKEGSRYQYWVHEQLFDTLHEEYSPPSTTEYLLLDEIEPARSTYYMPHLRREPGSFLSYAPRAFLNVLFRPWFNEAENLYQKAISAENIFYVLVFAFCLLMGNYKNVNWNLFWLGIFFAANLFLIIGFTTPVTGALVRYKCPALPFLLMSAFSLLDVEKVKRIPILRRLVAD